MVYLDDIFLCCHSCIEHLQHVKLVLDRLGKHKLYVRLSNCAFGVQEVDYLGFILRAGKITMNPNKIRAVEVWERSTNKKELQSFLSLVNFYQQFIRNCSEIAKPLTDLTKYVPFGWSDSVNATFLEMKSAIVTASVLAQFQVNQKIIVTTDACKYAIGAVSEQEHEDGRHPVAFITRA